MAFYKKDGSEILQAPNFVKGPEYELLAETHSDYTYPIDGWLWFDTYDEAIIYFAKIIEESNPEYAIPAHLGKAFLAGRPIKTEGPLATYPGNTLLDQISLMAKGQLNDSEYQIYLWITSWRRYSPMIVGLGQKAGFTPEEIDEWYRQVKMTEHDKDIP